MPTFGRPPEEVVECLDTILPLLQLGRRHEFVVIVQWFLDLATVVTDAPQGLEDDIDEALMVHGTGQFKVAEVPRVGLFVDVSKPWIVRATVHGLAVHLCLVPSNTRWDLPAIHRDGLRHRILS